MKKTLPELSIPPPKTQQIPQSPTSVTSSIPSVLQTPDDYQDFTIPHSLAALLDPGYERLTVFSGKPTDSQFSEFHANPHGPFPVDVVEPSSPMIAEPFAILGTVGGRDPYFIGLDSPHEYDRFIHSGRTIEALRPKKLSTHKSSPPRPRSKVSKSDKSAKLGSKTLPMRRKPEPMPPLPRNVFKPEVATPASVLTFAAVWDPEEGMATFRGDRLFESTGPPIKEKNNNILDDAHIRSRYMVPRTPLFDGRSKAVASSTLDGLDIYIPQRSKKGGKDKGSKPQRPPSVEDEGFFDSTLSDSGHPDCEPHLPSRFSVTTTSTSNYIDVDFPEGSVHEEPPAPPVPPIPEMHKLEKVASQSSIKSAISPPFLLLGGRRPSNPSSSTSSFNLPALVRSKSSPARNRPPLATHYPHQASLSSSHSPSAYKAPKPRLSNVLGKLRRNSQDEGWVSVEVTSVITDRVIKED